MPSPIGKFCNDDNSFCIDITRVNANDGQMWVPLKEHTQIYSFAGSYYHRDSTYTDVWLMTDNADARDSWQGEIDCLRGYPTLSAIRAHATGGGRHALTGYHLKEKLSPLSIHCTHSSAEAPLYGGLFVQLKL